MSGSIDAPGAQSAEGARALLSGAPRSVAPGEAAVEPAAGPPAAAADAQLNRRIGERVRTRRHGLGLTLKQVSARTGLSVSLISQIELGRSAASVQTLYKVSRSLDVPMATFFEGL